MSVLAATVLAAAAMIAVPQEADAAPDCARYAAPSGSDSAPGTAARPFRSAQRLLDSLSPGQTGCLAPGATYEGRVRVNDGGTPGSPITLTSGPGPGRATVRGWLFVPDGSTDVVFSNLVLDGDDSGSRVSPSVNGDRITFRGNVVTNDYYAICFHLGKPGEGVAEDIVIDRNRIHRCGVLPATGHDHGIYVNTSRNVRITNNYIYDNADYGIQLYPNARNTHIANNVIDGNGRGITFSGEGSVASSGNLAVDNIISNSSDTWNIEAYWGGPVGTGNRAERNCVWNGARGDIQSMRGVATAGNITADPGYVNRGAKDFRLRPGSACAGKGPRAAPTATPRPSPPPSAGPSAPAAGLRGGLRWIRGPRLVAKVRSASAGRLTLVAQAGKRRLGVCRRTVAAGGAALCGFRGNGVRPGTPLRVAGALKPASGDGVPRIRLARRAPRPPVLTTNRSWRSGKRLVVGLRSRMPGLVTMVAKAGGRTVGRCRRTVASNPVGCVFSARRVSGGRRVIVAVALDPRRGSSRRVRLAATVPGRAATAAANTRPGA